MSDRGDSNQSGAGERLMARARDCEMRLLAKRVNHDYIPLSAYNLKEGDVLVSDVLLVDRFNPRRAIQFPPGDWRMNP